MKVMLHVGLLGEDSGGRRVGNGYARLTVDPPFGQWKGIPIEQATWKEARQVENGTLSLSDGRPLVYLSTGMDRPDSAERFKCAVEMYRAHGWDMKG